MMALALGLGDIEVRSGLNQPFVAQIPLLAVSAEDAENLRAGLADNAEFERLGIERADYLSHLRFEVQSGATPYIAVSGNRPAREPFLMFLLDVRSGSSRILREYTVLLDPPTLATEGLAAADAAASPAASSSAPPPVAAAAAETPASAPTVTFVPLPPGTVLAEATSPSPTPTPVAATPVAATTSAVGEEYGPIAAGETFWAVTVKVVRSLQNVTVDQVMLALYTANPGAFDNGSINALMKGQVLSVPSADRMRDVSPEAATAQVQALRAAAGRSSAATTLAPTPTPTPTPRPTATPTPTAPPATPAPTPAAETAVERAVEPESPTDADATATDDLSTSAADVDADAEAGALAPTDEMTAMSEGDPSATAAPVASGSRAERVAEMLTTPTPAPTPAATPAPAAPPERPGLLDALLWPLLLLALLVVVVAAVLWRRRRSPPDDRQAPAVTPTAPASKAVPAAAASKPVVPDADAMADEAEAAVMAAYAKTATEDDRQRRDDTVPDFDATQVFDAPLDSGRKPVPDTTDFEATAQFSVDTVQIDLNAQDPVAEADIHLAYGLYDEAALTLTAALEEAPDDGALHAKLAEVYFAAGRPLEFVEAAEAARPHVSAADWQKLALFGSQIAPDSPLFADAAGADGDALAADLDLSFDDADETSSPDDAKVNPAGDEVDFDLDFDTPAPATTEEATAPQATQAPPGDNVLDFQLDDIDAVMASTPVLDLPDDGDASVTAAGGEDAAPDNTLEFRLDDFGDDTATTTTPEPVPNTDSAPPAEPSAEAPTAADVPGDGLSGAAPDFEAPSAAAPPASGLADAGGETSVPLELDLAEFDLGVGSDSAGDEGEAGVDSATIEEFKLDDFELESDSDVISSGDEAGTKLDLARAYVDMGDNEMARVLLDEVLAQGSDAQKSDARALISRLD